MTSRVLGLAAAMLLIFAVTVAILLRFIPAPRTDADYLIIGCIATFISLLILFIVLITTWVKSPDPFFKRRKR